MDRKSFLHYQEFLQTVAEFWPKLGPEFRVKDWSLERVQEEKNRLSALNEQIEVAERELGDLRWQRDRIGKDIEGLNVALRASVIGFFGNPSLMLTEVPRLMKSGVGRPNKAAATRKANTLKRKMAALEAQNSAPETSISRS